MNSVFVRALEATLVIELVCVIVAFGTDYSYRGATFREETLHMRHHIFPVVLAAVCGINVRFGYFYNFHLAAGPVLKEESRRSVRFTDDTKAQLFVTVYCHLSFVMHTSSVEERESGVQYALTLTPPVRLLLLKATRYSPGDKSFR